MWCKDPSTNYRRPDNCPIQNLFQNCNVPKTFSLLLTVSYNLDFVRISKVFDRIYVACQWGEFRVKNANLRVRILFRRFLLLFVFSW